VIEIDDAEQPERSSWNSGYATIQNKGMAVSGEQLAAKRAYGLEGDRIKHQLRLRK